jgi:hypothetical protein
MNRLAHVDITSVDRPQLVDEQWSIQTRPQSTMRLGTVVQFYSGESDTGYDDIEASNLNRAVEAAETARGEEIAIRALNACRKQRHIVKAIRYNEDLHLDLFPAAEASTRAIRNAPRPAYAALELRRLSKSATEHWDEEDEEIPQRLLDFLLRFGEEAVEAIRDEIAASVSPISLLGLQLLGRSDDPSTLNARRNLLRAALADTDPGTRYAAAIGLGEIGDDEARRALRERLAIEQNGTVRSAMNAHLA